MEAHQRLNSLLRDSRLMSSAANISFLGQYRQARITHFTFRSVNLTRTVADQLKEWLNRSIDRVRIAYEAYDTEPSAQPHEVSLGDLTAWDRFEASLRTPTIFQPEELLKRISKDAIAYVVSITHADFVVGYLRRMEKRNVLRQSGRYRVFTSGTTLSRISEEKGIIVDAQCDFVFLVDREGKTGWALNERNYEKFFDINEERMKNAVRSIGSSELMKFIPFGEEVMTLVKSDRGLQNQLLSTNVQTGISEFEIDKFRKSVEILQKGGVELQFSLRGDKVLINDGNRRKGVSQLLGVVGYRYSRSLTNEHLVESSGVKLLT